jgi:hypothetical protein
MKKQPLLVLFVLAIFSFACRKNSFITSSNATVAFSADTLLFDTVFVSTGSITEQVKIINANNRKLRLSSVKLMGGNQSYFHLNIDGSPGPELENIDLDAGDSIYVFVAVDINPQAANLPFIIQDSIQVDFNGNQRYIQLEAWGQNAHFLNNVVITGNTVWDNKLPYVILGGLQVDTTALLSIPAGCKIYFHANAPLLVDGTLLVNGDHYDSTHVYFQGDRLDKPYSSFPGSWPGIYFRGTSAGNDLKYAVIQDAYQSVVAEAPPAGTVPKVLLEQCIINNSYDAGILGAQGSLEADNCLISNCGKNIELGGGHYVFSQCTDAAYSNLYLAHTLPVLTVTDASEQGSVVVTGNLQASFTNCIFWGGQGVVTNEVAVSQQGSGSFAVNFSNCLWKVAQAPSGVGATGIIANQDPLFDSVNNSTLYYDFHLQAGSPALGAGLATGLTFDLDGKPWPATAPALGCYN